MAKGYSQCEGTDYQDTFSPVAMLKSIRILLVVVAYHDIVMVITRSVSCKGPSMDKTSISELEHSFQRYNQIV